VLEPLIVLHNWDLGLLHSALLSRQQGEVCCFQSVAIAYLLTSEFLEILIRSLSTQRISLGMATALGAPLWPRPPQYQKSPRLTHRGSHGRSPWPTAAVSRQGESGA